MRTADRLAAGIAAVLAVFAVLVSDPELGARLFRGVFVQDADEIIRAWYGRCSFDNPNIIPFSHLSMPGWTAVLAVGEALARALGWPLTLMGRLSTVLFAWAGLRHAAAWLRALGASEARAALGVLVLAASPGFFLMAITVYPEVALLALTLGAMRYLAEDRPLAAALTIGWAPLVRWEGALLLALVVGVLLLRRAGLRAVAVALAPYGAYLAAVAIRFGNPWTPLAWRTTKAMGAWRLFNPDLQPGAWGEAVWSLFTLHSPVALLGALPFALLALADKRRAPLALAFGGLATLLFSVQHDFMVYPIRVFVVPAALGVMVLASASQRWALSLAAVGAAFSVGTGWRYVNDLPLPAPGRARDALGFHSFVRYADATEVLGRLSSDSSTNDGWLVVNHMNANLLRADTQCGLLRHDLRIGGPNISLSREFRPTFGLPDGAGRVVFHTLPIGMESCTLEARFDAAGQSVYRCAEGTRAPVER